MSDPFSSDIDLKKWLVSELPLNPLLCTISFDFCQLSLWIVKIKNRSKFKFLFWLLWSFLILICSQSPWLFLLRWVLFSHIIWPIWFGFGLVKFPGWVFRAWTYQSSIDIVADKVHFVVSSYIEQIHRLLAVAVLLDLSAWISVAG